MEKRGDSSSLVRDGKQSGSTNDKVERRDFDHDGIDFVRIRCNELLAVDFDSLQAMAEGADREVFDVAGQGFRIGHDRRVHVHHVFANDFRVFIDDFHIQLLVHDGPENPLPIELVTKIYFSD